MAKSKKVIVALPSEIQKGSIVSVEVVGKGGAKAGLKVVRLTKRYVSVMEIDRPNRKNIFRKFLLTDVVEVGNTESHQFLIKFANPPFSKEESGWDSIGQGGYQRPAYSNHSKGWSSNAPQYRGVHFVKAGDPIPTTNSIVVITK